MRVGDNMKQSLTYLHALLPALLRVQMTALGMRMTRQTSTAKKKKRGSGSAGTVGMAILWVFVGLSFMVMFGSVFGMLAEPFHAMGFDWLYMTLAFLMCSMFMLLGTVFLAKSMLFEAKDNALLLAMPIPSTIVLCARMIVFR